MGAVDHDAARDALRGRERARPPPRSRRRSSARRSRRGGPGGDPGCRGCGRRQSRPSASMPRKLWGCPADTRALAAPASVPSVPFLKPTGIESPLAISRWVWLSVVRAPIAAHATRSARYWGVTGSSTSVAQGQAELVHREQDPAREREPVPRCRSSRRGGGR